MRQIIAEGTCALRFKLIEFQLLQKLPRQKTET